MNISRKDIEAMEKRYRTTFINSLPGYKSLHMVGTVNKEGVTNLALFNAVFHVGANPPLLGMIVRPDAEGHDTLDNIRSTGQYTLNNVLPDWYQQAHQSSARYPSGVSEFADCGFDAFFADGFKAPFVRQSTIKIGLELRETMAISINKTTLAIGEIVQVFLNDDDVDEDGYVDPIRAKSITVCGLDSYFTTEKLGRLPYAKSKP